MEQIIYWNIMSNVDNYSDYVDSWMSTRRIETLVDGIFAISMTLLVLTIGIPQSQVQSLKQPSNNK